MTSQELGRLKFKLTNLESPALAERDVKLRDDLLELHLVIINIKLKILEAVFRNKSKNNAI